MSLLEQIKKIVRETPNDIIMAAKVRSIINKDDEFMSSLETRVDNLLDGFDEFYKITKK